MQRLRFSDPRHLSKHSALHNDGFCAAHSLANLCLSTTFGPGPGDFPAPCSFATLLSLGRGRITTTSGLACNCSKSFLISYYCCSLKLHAYKVLGNEFQFSFCTNEQPPQCGSAVCTTSISSIEIAVGFPKGPRYSSTLSPFMFLWCRPLKDCMMTTCTFLKGSRL